MEWMTMIKTIVFTIMILLITSTSDAGSFVYKKKRYSGFEEFKHTQTYAEIKARVRSQNAEAKAERERKVEVIELSDDLKLIKKWRSGHYPYMKQDETRNRLKDYLFYEFEKKQKEEEIKSGIIKNWKYWRN